MNGVSRESLADLQDRLESVAGEHDDATLRAVGDDLMSVVHLLDRETSLRRVLGDPALEAAQKSGLARSLFADRIGPVAQALVEQAVRLRWSRPRDLADAGEQLAVGVLAIVAERAGHLDDVEDELFRFGRIVERESRLRAALTDPGLPDERKVAVLDAIVISKVTPVAGRLIREVVLQPRGRTLDTAIEEVSRQVAARRNRLVAIVRSAVALTPEQQQRLAASLQAAYGHRVHLNVELDPTVLGGLSVRVGDEVFDGTVAQRLAEARRRLAG